jgi:hypothetical protein
VGLVFFFFVLNFSLLSNPLKRKKRQNPHHKTHCNFFVSKFFITYVLHCSPIDIIEGQNLRRILWSLVV